MIPKKRARTKRIKRPKHKKHVSNILEERNSKHSQCPVQSSEATVVNTTSKLGDEDLPRFKSMCKDSIQIDVKNSKKILDRYIDTDGCHDSQSSPISRTCPQITDQEQTSGAEETEHKKSGARCNENVLSSTVEKKTELRKKNFENRDSDTSITHPNKAELLKNGSIDEENNLQVTSTPTAFKYNDNPTSVVTYVSRNAKQRRRMVNDILDEESPLSGANSQQRLDTFEDNLDQQKTLTQSASQCISHPTLRSPIDKRKSLMLDDASNPKIPRSTFRANILDHQEISEASFGQPKLSLPPFECFVPRPAWRGSLYVSGVEYGPIVGYISPTACRAVDKVVWRFPRYIFFQNLPMQELLPPSFESRKPAAKDVALYLLPGNSCAKALLYELLEELIAKQHALRAPLRCANLLVFPSRVQLSECSMVNEELYLWGIFRVTPPRAQVGT